MNAPRTLTTSEILAAATEQLTTGGYRRVEVPADSWANTRVFEDRFGIVALVVFDTWAELVREWPQAQGTLVELLSRSLSRSDPKAWEGYLVLLTPGIRGRSGDEEWMGIRYNTKRIRKLVGSGENLQSVGDVRAALAPLLPLDLHDVTGDLQESLLSLLPQLLQQSSGIAPDVTIRIVEAFSDQRNMMQALHDFRTGA